MCFSFFCRKVILELNAQHHFFRASKNTNSVFSATKQIMRMLRPTKLKNLFLSEKIAKYYFKSKLKYMKKVSF